MTQASKTLTFANDSRKLSSEANGVYGIPHLVRIGRNGKVVNVHRGYCEEGFDVVVAKINTALAARHESKS